jgi:hypothetical protein
LQRRRFETYLDKVFDGSTQVAALPEGRKFPRHSWKKVFDAVFLGTATQIANLHPVEAQGRRGVWAQRIGPLSEDTLGYALQRQDPTAVFTWGCAIARRLKRNGVLHSDWARGRVLAAVDGIEICSSFSRCCDACMEREVEHKVHGQTRKDLPYYHRIVAVVEVSTRFPLPLGIRFQKDGETEVAGAMELLGELDQHLGRRFLDVVVADALYLQQGFVNAVEGRNLEWVINLKDNQPELRAEAQQMTSGPASATRCDDGEEIQLWHAPEVYWPVARRCWRVVKTLRRRKVRPVQVRRDPTGQKQKAKQGVEEESTNYYACNLELGSIPPAFIPPLGRSRWRVDTEVFQTLTTPAHLKQPSVHQPGALLLLTMIRVLGYTLSLVFYHRQVASHAHPDLPTFSELARLLAYSFCAPRLDSSSGRGPTPNLSAPAERSAVVSAPHPKPAPSRDRRTVPPPVPKPPALKNQKTLHP